MPGHDHSLRKLYTIEGLSNPSMVYNWICPVLLKEDCPYEALARVFSTYFKNTSGINTSEDYLNFGWAAPLFSESDWSTMKHHTNKEAIWLYAELFLGISMSWFVVVHSGSWWFNVMVCGGSWWFIVVRGGS